MDNSHSQYTRPIYHFVTVLAKISPATLKLALVLITGALSLLLASGLIAIPNRALAAAATFCAIFLLPGFLTSDLLSVRRGISLAVSIPVYFVLGMSLYILPGLALLILHSNLEFLRWITVTIGLLLICLYSLRMRRGLRESDVSIAPFTDNRLNLFLVGTCFLLALLTLVILISTAGLFVGGDKGSYIAYVRNHMDAFHLTVASPFLKRVEVTWREMFNVSLLLHALISKLSRVDPTYMYALYFPPLLAVMSLLAFYGLAKELFKDRNTAMFATALQMIYFASDITSNEGIGFAFFIRLVEDKFTAWFVILPVAVLFMLRYLSTRRKGYLWALVGSSAILATIHPVALVQCALSFGSFALIHLLFNRRRDRIVAFFFVFLPLFVFAVVPFVQRRVLYSWNNSFFDISNPDIGYLLRGLQSDTLLILSLERGLYMSHPHLIEHPLVILSILSALLSIRYIRENVAAQFVFSNMFVPLLILYNPVVAPLVGKVITPLMLWRLTWVLPVSLATGFMLCRGLKWIRERLLQIRFFIARPHLMQLMPSLVLGLALVMLSGGIVDGLDFLARWKQRAPSQDELTFLFYMREHLPPGNIILTDSQFSYKIPAFVGRNNYGITYRTYQYTPEDKLAIEDTEHFFGSELVDSSITEILNRWMVKYVIVERGSLLAFQFKLLSPVFHQVFSSDEYELYEVASDLKSNHVIAGNTYLSSGQWDKAITEYEQALRIDPADPLAFLGLAKVYQSTGEVEQAITNYSKTVANSPDREWPRLYLAKAYVAKGQMAEEREAYNKALEAYRQAFDLAPDDPEVHDALIQAYLALGDQYFEQGLLFQVIAAYEKATELDPNNIQVYWKLAEVYETLSRTDDAMAEYARIVERWPDRADAHFRLGQAYEAGGDVEKAVAEYERAVELEPMLTGAYTRLANLYRNQDRMEDAIVLYQAAARKNPTAAWPHVELGKVYLDQVNAP